MTRIRSAAIAVLLAASLVTPARAQASGCADATHPGGDWPIFGKDLANSRNQTAETTIDASNVGSLEPAWVFTSAPVDGGAGFESTAMVSEGCVYIATQGGSIYAINADTGDIVWSATQPAPVTTLSVANGRVFADVSDVDEPKMVAYDQFTGQFLWRTVLATHRGAETTGSPTAFADMVITGISCGAVEISTDPAERLGCRGGVLILDQATGEILSTAWVIPDEDFARNMSGGGVWSAAAIDEADGYAYYGTGNPYSADEHPNTNAIIKVDVDRSRATFGQIVDAYHGNFDQYLPPLGARKPVCAQTQHHVATCELLDLDMAMAPNIFETSTGTKLVGDGQSSGIYHAVTASTMSWVWQSVVGAPPSAGRSGGSAYDGEHIYTAGGVHVWALERDDGAGAWVEPTVGGTSFSPVAHANGVVYVLPSLGGASVLQAFDAQTGVPLLVRPTMIDAGEVMTGTQASGVTIARNTVYVPQNGATSSYLIAYRLPG